MKVLHVLIALTWELPQTLAGFCVWLVTCRKKWEDKPVRAGSKNFFVWGNDSGLSLGYFRFVPSWGNITYTSHEYGHSIQSHILGPLYLLVIGLPSILWAGVFHKNSGKSYYWFYTESWAEKLGGNT